MLESLRRAAGTWVAKILLLLLVLSFGVWGISGSMLGGFGNQNVITVGGTEVSATDYRLAYNRQVNLYSQQFGQQLTRDQARSFGVDQQVLAQLIGGAVLDEQARELNLGLSKDRLALLVSEDPTFRGQDGRFNRQAFDYILGQIGMRSEDYLRTRSQDAKRQQIVEAVSDGFRAPDTFLRAAALYQGEDRTAEFVVLPESLVQPVAAPSEEVLSAWFEQNKQRYAAPEYRKFRYIKLEPEDIVDLTAVADDQVRADYDANKAQFTTPETRTVEQLVFPNADAAKTAHDALAGGKTFDQLVAEQGKTPADVALGTVTKDSVPDQGVADTAFGLQVNQVSDVVQGMFGPVLLRVTAINPEQVKPFDAVKEEIRRDLALAEANRVLLDVHDSYEDARAGGESMQEAADRLKLKITTIDAIDRNALDVAGNVINTLPSSRDLIQAVFDAEVGTENPAINVGSNGYVFYELDGTTPARDRTLDEVREKVVADWTAQETTRLLTEKATELQKRVEGGASLDDIAAEVKSEKQTKRGLKRGADDADFGQDGVAAVFDVAQNAVGTFAAPTDGNRILFKVTEVFEPAGADASSLPEAARNTFTSGMSSDLLDQLIAKLSSKYSVSTNQAAIDQALAF
ncbi:peptidyl-prolyl cis-trans isomerase [Oryzicola mucosus]|uniref:Parvulin-like PPIase n=1 Tax=Oryzicola mucosus TaxID=2767425 RepID=A0A8J6U8W6_9HYPH|nr:SurA N-terminal domain-containing protein [Oryzicola mucosus]MBD0416262.1 SurA N-terminal domain-containing protein [Oryzicola mucosus]